MQRTKDTMTAGIVNIPLTKPARVFFYVDSNFKEISDMFESMKIGYQYIKLPSGKIQVISLQEIQSWQIKNIFHNFRTLKPKLESQWRYLFWEIDEQDKQTLDFVISLYNLMKLPLYCHKSMRGYHFLSVKPLEKSLWQYCITQLRETNEQYPPVTLRVLANKYVDELISFRDGFVISQNQHTDTTQLRNYIYSQNIEKLQEHYFIVWYEIPQQEKLDKMSLSERTTFQEGQI